MNALLTFTGFHDPFFHGLVDEEEQPGPILSLLAARPFDRVYLFSTPATERVTLATERAISKLHPDIQTLSLDVHLEDPTDYIQIIAGLRPHILQIQEQHSDAAYFIAVASGTPQMHACWVMLAAGGEIPARILNIRPPRFVTKETPLVNEIDFASKEYPSVRWQPCLSNRDAEHGPDFLKCIAQHGIVGDHPAMQHALEIGATLASSETPILLLGETGTGKELFAKFVHGMSARPRGIFVPVNCAAIPENLVESILFGHKKGAFTGAHADQKGKFDAANGGTLFLDELGDLPLPAQAKLLRVLQDAQIEPVGETKPHEVDVRIIAATNRDLRKLIRQGKFREDLFYRINVGEIRLPPLKERRSDIPKLALHIMDRLNRSLKKPRRFSTEALNRLQAHSWPGNIRDLENVIERSARLCRKDKLDADDLLIGEPVTYADPLDSLPDPHEGFSLDDFLSSARKQLILKALEASGGNQSQAARMLGMTPQAVHKFVQQSKTA